MFNISEFELIKLNENKELYNYQCNLINRRYKMDLTDFVLELALLQTMIPIADYYVAIGILKSYYQKNNDVRIGILGAFLSSVWESFKKNDFLPVLESSLSKLNDYQQKSIIYYLLAYDMIKHSEIKTKESIYANLLTKSINLSKEFVYNYYYLAQISDKLTAKKLMLKAFTQIKKIYNESDCKKIELNKLVTYDFFLKEAILGIEPSISNFETLIEFYMKL
jgi:hypothetical protein